MFSRNMVIRLIKIIDIAFITAIYFIVGFFIGWLIDDLFDIVFGGVGTKHVLIVLGECILTVCTIAVISYLGRNVIQGIPFPLDGYMGFQHMRVKEVSGGGMLLMFIVVFSSNLRAKLTYVRNKSEDLKNENLHLTTHVT